jgi:Fe-only nitrogenase accessory protein AnfO
MEIAALLDDDGQATAPESGGTIYVFGRSEGNWVCTRELPFNVGSNATMQELRGYVSQVCEWLGDCKILAAKPAIGFYRVTFGGCGIALWPVKGSPENFIEQVEDFYLRSTQAASEPPEEVDLKTLIEPVPGRAGHYRVDLRDAMAVKGAHNSQQVLLPFFQEANFVLLEILCDHQPRWFERVLPELNLRAVVESASDVTRVHVEPIRGMARAAMPDAAAFASQCAANTGCSSSGGCE